MNFVAQLYNFVNQSSLGNLLIFILGILLAIGLGQLTIYLVDLGLVLLVDKNQKESLNRFIKPIRIKINRAGTFLLLYAVWKWLETKEQFGGWLYVLVDFIFTLLLFWMLSFLFEQLIKVYGVTILQKIGGETTEILLAIETLFNLIIGFVILAFFAYKHGVPINGIIAGASISGLALSFAAQNTLQQLFGTVILFLDKPFIHGEYIRLPNNILGRVESIGLRSTKIRTAGKNTLLIVPNSKMADWEIENITRGKKILLLVYLDFERFLDQYEQSLVEQKVIKGINSFFGVEPDTANVTFLNHPHDNKHRARVTFFILGSTQSSIELREIMMNISETQLAQELETYGIYYTANEPVISVDSSISL